MKNEAPSPMTWHKVLMAAAVICIAFIAMSAPAGKATAQSNATPTLAIITVTPSGSSDTSAATGDASAATDNATVATGEADPSDTLSARGDKAYFVAKAVLAKQLHHGIGPVSSYTWELALFHDTSLGCPGPSDNPKKGDVVGFIITINYLGKTYEFHVSYDLTQVFSCATVGGSNSSALPAPVSGKAIGGVFEAGGQIQDFNGNTVGNMRAAGLKWVKRQLAVGDGSGPGIISAAHAQNFKVLLSVKGNAGDVLGSGYFDTYASFVAGLASSGADAIEVWNEENIDREWPTGHIDPSVYTQMLAKAYNAIKGANGNTIVVSGALAPTGYWGGSAGKSDNGWDDDVYYQGMAAAGATQYMDCVGVHYNEGVVSPQQSSGDPRDNYPTRYYSTMLNRALGPFGSKPGCFTELGYLTPEGYGPLPSGFAWAQNTTVAEQAQWLAQAAVLSAQSGRVRLMIVFNVDFSYYGTDPQAGYAMERPNNVCPACTSLGQVLK